MIPHHAAQAYALAMELHVRQQPIKTAITLALVQLARQMRDYIVEGRKVDVEKAKEEALQVKFNRVPPGQYDEVHEWYRQPLKDENVLSSVDNRYLQERRSIKGTRAQSRTINKSESAYNQKIPLVDNVDP